MLAAGAFCQRANHIPESQEALVDVDSLCKLLPGCASLLCPLAACTSRIALTLHVSDICERAQSLIHLAVSMSCVRMTEESLALALSSITLEPMTVNLILESLSWQLIPEGNDMHRGVE